MPSSHDVHLENHSRHRTPPLEKGTGRYMRFGSVSAEHPEVLFNPSESEDSDRAALSLNLFWSNQQIPLNRLSKAATTISARHRLKALLARNKMPSRRRSRKPRTASEALSLARRTTQTEATEGLHAQIERTSNMGIRSVRKGTGRRHPALRPSPPFARRKIANAHTRALGTMLILRDGARPSIPSASRSSPPSRRTPCTRALSTRGRERRS